MRSIFEVETVQFLFFKAFCWWLFFRHTQLLFYLSIRVRGTSTCWRQEAANRTELVKPNSSSLWSGLDPSTRRFAKRPTTPLWRWKAVGFWFATSGFWWNKAIDLAQSHKGELSTNEIQYITLNFSGKCCFGKEKDWVIVCWMTRNQREFISS